MRLVVDTNVIIITALKNSSWPGEMVLWLGRYGGLLKSVETEQEALAVLARPRIASKILPAFVNEIALLFSTAELVSVNTSVVDCRDPKDNKFLALAVDGHADVIVSGDADLLVLEISRGVPIVTPAASNQARLA